MPPRTLVIACGALAREVMALVRGHGWSAIEVQCLPAVWHNHPERIPGGVREKIRAWRAGGGRGRVFVAYADCGAGGALDAVVEAEGAERLPGAHCYEVYAGGRAFAALHEAEPGTLYLTDYLARNFERLIIRGLGIDRHPELLPTYFGSYRRLVHLAQTRDGALRAAAREAAGRLGLEFEHRWTGYGGLAPFLARAADGARTGNGAGAEDGAEAAAADGARTGDVDGGGAEAGAGDEAGAADGGAPPGRTGQGDRTVPGRRKTRGGRERPFAGAPVRAAARARAGGLAEARHEENAAGLRPSARPALEASPARGGGASAP